jgi:hypothetical protein
MSELGNGNSDSNEDMTGLDRVRKQLDRVLNRNDPNESERKKQFELRTEVDKLLAQHNISSGSTDECQNDNEPSYQMSSLLPMLWVADTLNFATISVRAETDNLRNIRFKACLTEF